MVLGDSNYSVHNGVQYLHFFVSLLFKEQVPVYRSFRKTKDQVTVTYNGFVYIQYPEGITDKEFMASSHISLLIGLTTIREHKK